MSKFDTASFTEGLLKGVISNIDRKAKEKQKEIELQRDITKHILQKKADMELNKSWLEDMKKQIPPEFVKPSGGPAEGLAQIFGAPEVSGSRAGQVPTVATEATETGRRPMMGQDVDLESIAGAQSPSMTSTGVSMRPMSAYDKMLNTYNALTKIEESGRPLNAQQQYMKRALGQKLNLMPKEETEETGEGFLADLDKKYGSGTVTTPNTQTTKQLDKNTAMQFLQEAGGDKEKARQLAKQRGYTF